MLIFQADPYGMQSLNPNHYRVVTKQEPDDMDHYDRGKQACQFLKFRKEIHDLGFHFKSLKLDFSIELVFLMINANVQ